MQELTQNVLIVVLNQYKKKKYFFLMITNNKMNFYNVINQYKINYVIYIYINYQSDIT